MFRCLSIILVVMQLVRLAVAELEKYPFSVKEISRSEVEKPEDPGFQDYFISKGVQGDHKNGVSKNYNYSQLVPYVRRMDMLIENCHFRDSSTCIFVRQEYVTGLPNDKHFVILIHNDARHRHYFENNMLPFFEKRYERSNGTAGVMLHVGGYSDRSCGEDSYQIYRRSKSIVRIFMFNSNTEGISNSTIEKVKVIPQGIAMKAIGSGEGMYGDLLRRKMREAEAADSSAGWGRRKDRLLICFFNDYADRPALKAELAKSCAICDFCYDKADPVSTEKAIPVDRLWTLFTQYKFILSPLGLGLECGRTWEIMLLGAIPVMAYSPVVHGYLHHNMPVISFKNSSELTETSLASWVGAYSRPIDKKFMRLSYFLSVMELA